MNRKHLSRLAAITLAVATASPALAAPAASSQFHVKGWPCKPSACSHSICAGSAQTAATCPPVSSGSGSAVRATRAPSATTAPGFTAAPTAAPVIPSTDDDYTMESLSAQEQTAVYLMNQDRIANGLAALPVDEELSRLARLKSEDMRDNGYFAHTSPVYGSAADLLRRFGYAFSGVGENIAHHATVHKSQAAFMSSDGHRRNILGSHWSKTGIGVCYDANGYVYVTQLFVR